MPLRVIDCRQENFRSRLGHRGSATSDGVAKIVADIIEQVRTQGDEALLRLAKQFDSPDLSGIAVCDEELDRSAVSITDRETIENAFERILAFHRKQLSVVTSGWTQRDAGYEWQMDAQTRLGQRMTPLKRVGIYVPGGRAAYPSSVLMLAGPAQVAGVEEIVCTTPAQPDGTLHPAVLAALSAAGVKKTFKVGGAGAIAAMALGTESVPRVDKVAGPGNKFVNEAKRQLWGTVGLDGFAGPSEVCVLADETANAAFAAADFLTQIEHAPDNAGFLISTDAEKLSQIVAEIERQLAIAPRREILEEALAKESLGFLARNLDEAIEIVNAIAPEHLTVAVRNSEAILGRLVNAGCVLMGDWTPESAADYALGPSHTLPTGGAARFAGPVNVMDFLKIQSFAQMTKEQSAAISPLAEAFGTIEGLPAHAFGAKIRLDA
jgi:histidinol dehydrogenase